MAVKKSNSISLESEFSTAENIEDIDVKDVLKNNYLPYGYGTIISRAIPSIDGFKPAHRRILYTMYKMGLLSGGKIKSSNIVGQSMWLIPHGDQTIYDTLVRMTTGNNSLNAPYIESKGNFGKVDSRDMAYAAPRYTEAKLAPICEELFDGIDEDAVEFVNNYDDSRTEPVFLPAKFPALLVNTAPGIAVGMASSMPSFNLKEVCEAAIGRLKGEIVDCETLYDVLGAPDFSTGGYIHGSRKDFINILKTGRGSVMLSGKVTVGKNNIVINEIPYSTSIEAIIEDTKKYVKSGDIKELSDVRDESDIRGTRVVFDVKRGFDPEDVLKKLYKYTRLRTSMGVNNNVIIDGRPCQTGILETLDAWVRFRLETVCRIYKYRLSKALNTEELLSAWEKVASNLQGALEIITNNVEVEAKAKLMNLFNMNEKQADYLLDMRAKDFTIDRVNNKLNELEKTRNNIQLYNKVIASEDERKLIVISELDNIKQKYGKNRRTIVSDVPVKEKIEEVVDAGEVYVYITKNGFVKRNDSPRSKGYGTVDESELFKGDKVEYSFFTRNNDKLVIFGFDGSVYKIPVCNIDNSKGTPKMSIKSIVGCDVNILDADVYGDGSKSINIVYGNGKGYNISYKRVSGNRTKYSSVYDEGDSGNMWSTRESEFFLITRSKKAAFFETNNVFTQTGKSTFRVARVGNESIFGLQPASRVPDYDKIDTDEYKKGYFVKIRNRLW